MQPWHGRMEHLKDNRQPVGAAKAVPNAKAYAPATPGSLDKPCRSTIDIFNVKAMGSRAAQVLKTMAKNTSILGQSQQEAVNRQGPRKKA